jgi:hypothetical protein
MKTLKKKLKYYLNFSEKSRFCWFLRWKIALFWYEAVNIAQMHLVLQVHRRHERDKKCPTQKNEKTEAGSQVWNAKTSGRIKEDCEE